MISISEVLEINWIILYFIYGQVFFIMGLVTGLQWRRPSHLELARSLPWLALFGITHGLTEWGYIFVPLQSLYLDDSVVNAMIIVHLLLLAISFFALFQFGIELLLSRWPGNIWMRAIPGVLLFLWGIGVLLRSSLMDDPLNVLVAIGDSWSRYLLCLPGSALAYLGLRRQARLVKEMDLPRIANYLTGAAIAFLVYALVAGLIVPTAPVFPANLLNYAWLDQVIQLPVPVFRSVCGLAMAFFVVRSLDIFQAETDRRIAEMERAQILTADRVRIGRELHDGIIQNIYAAGLDLERMQRQMRTEPERVQRIQGVLDILTQTIEDIRHYIFDLRAAEQPQQLEIVLDELVRDLRLDTLLEIDLRVTGQRCWKMNPEQTSHLTQIAREALSNVVQHAQAQHVRVELRYSNDHACLTIADDGMGSDPGAWSEDALLGHGIANMRERAKLLGAEFELESEPGKGLELSVKVPCGDSHDQG